MCFLRRGVYGPLGKNQFMEVDEESRTSVLNHTLSERSGERRGGREDWGKVGQEGKVANGLVAKPGFPLGTSDINTWPESWSSSATFVPLDLHKKHA